MLAASPLHQQSSSLCSTKPIAGAYLPARKEVSCTVGLQRDETACKITTSVIAPIACLTNGLFQVFAAAHLLHQHQTRVHQALSKPQQLLA